MLKGTRLVAGEVISEVSLFPRTETSFQYDPSLDMLPRETGSKEKVTILILKLEGISVLLE